MRRGRGDRIDTPLVAGLAAAYSGFALTFRGPRERFWRRMTIEGAVLGSLALASEPRLAARPGRKPDLLRGLLSAAALYAAFSAGDRVARKVMPSGADDIEAIYSLRTGQDRRRVGAQLALVIAPAEELFWRGLVQRRLERSLGTWRGATTSVLLYGGAHLSTGNPTLVAAATVAGAWWSLLAARGETMGSLVTSHVVWDLVVFLLAPTSRVAGAGRGDGPVRPAGASAWTGTRGDERGSDGR